ncbi:MAG: hypothetical protein AAGJ79_08690 [Verrucomicrobiota bacterium]
MQGLGTRVLIGVAIVGGFALGLGAAWLSQGKGDGAANSETTLSPDRGAPPLRVSGGGGPQGTPSSGRRSTAPATGTLAAVNANSNGLLTERLRNYMRVINSADAEAYPDLMNEAIREFGRYGPFSHLIMPMLAQQWVDADPMGAFEASFSGQFASVIGEDDWGDAFGPILRTALESYPEEVKAIALANQHLGAAERTLERLVVDEAKTNVAKALETIGAITNSELRDEVVESFLHRYAKSAPEKALALVEEFPGASIPRRKLRDIFTAFAQEDPENALAKVERLQTRELRQSALGAIAQAWGRKDHESALAYIEQIESAATRSEMLRQLHSSLANSDPEAAAYGSLQITDRSERQRAISQSASKWFEKDPGSVRAWMDSNLGAEMWMRTAEQLVQSQQNEEKFAAVAPIAESLAGDNESLENFVKAWNRHDAEALEAWIGTQSFERQNTLRGIREAAQQRIVPIAESISTFPESQLTTSFEEDPETGKIIQVTKIIDPETGREVVVQMMESESP